MKVTISDVAKLAGVSTATVSHTINNTRYVSNETKEKVYRAIEELGYTPDASARSFRTGKKKIIGFIVPDIANKFFATMIESVEKYLSANGYQLIIANTRENMDREETNIRLLTAGLVDGLLVASTMDDFQRFDALIPAGFPVVLVDRIFETKKYSSVCVSNFQPIYRSVCRLAGKGDQRIGIIGGLPRLSSTQERISAYRQAVADCGLPEDMAERIVDLVGHHHTLTDVDGMDYQILIEADYLVNADESHYSQENIRHTMETVFRTATGISLLQSAFLDFSIP